MVDVGTTATPTGTPLPTVATPVPEVTDPTPVAVRGKGPEIVPSPLLALLYLSVPFDEKAWPRIEFGEAPFKTEALKAPWVEAFDASEPVNLDSVVEEAIKRWEEINSGSTVEESEDLQINEVFAPGLGSIIRNVTFSFGEGGADPVVRISGTTLANREDPLLRVATVLQDMAVREKSKPEEVEIDPSGLSFLP